MAGSRRIVVEFLGKDVSAGKTASEVEGKFGKLSGKLQSVGAAAGRFLAVGALAGGAAMVKFGQQASDLEETMNKTNVVFGKSSAAVVKWSESAARNLGLSQQAALAFTSQFGDMFKQLGATEGEAAKTSQGIVKLATDLGSFHNLETGDVLDKIAGAMRGEYDAIQKIIPGLSDARVKQEALRMSGKNSVTQLTEQDKAMAALAIVTKDGASAHNDFAETSDGLANKQKILKAEFEDVTTKLGGKMLPIMTKVTGAGIKMLAWTEKHSKATKILAGGIGGLVVGVWAASKAISAFTTILKVWKAIVIVARNVQLAWNLAMMANPIGAVILALVALGVGLVVLYKKSETFRRIVNGALEGVGKVAKWLWNNAFQPALKMIVTGFGWVLTGIGKLLSLLGKIPGFEWAKEAGRKMEAAGRAARYLAQGIKDIPEKKKVTVTYNTKYNGQGQTNNPRFAKGTPSAPRGWAWTGEEGPELVKFRGGEQVVPHGRSMAMAGRGGGSSTAYATINLNLDGKTVQQVLLKLKRTNGGLELGLA